MKQLYTFQKEALDSLAGHDNVLLAWQMGTGKTISSIEQAKRYQSSCLVCLVPKSTAGYWKDTLKEQAPDYRVFDGYKKSKKEGLDAFISHPGKKALVLGYDAYKTKSMLKLRTYISKNAENVCLICDESSLLGKLRSERTRAVMETRAAHVILLSGTPASGGKLENLVPTANLLGWDISKMEFLDRYCETREWVNYMAPQYPIRIITGYRNIQELHENLKKHGTSFLTIDDAGIQLPQMREEVVSVETTGEYKRFLKERCAYVSKLSLVSAGDRKPGQKPEEQKAVLVGDTASSKFLYSRQICAPYNANKLRAVKDLLESADGERAVIFYNWTEELLRLRVLCEDLNRPVSIVNGDGCNLLDYQDKNNCVTLCQYRAGSVGLNLQKARIGIMYSPSLSCTEYDQAKARMYRIGQERNVMIYNLICRGTVEEKIYQALLAHEDYTQQLFNNDFEAA